MCIILTSLFNMSNLADHSSFPLAATAFASSISFSNAAMSDWSTSTFLFRKLGELKMSDSSSEGSRDAFASEGGFSLSDEDITVSSASVPSLDASASASAHKIVDCTCHDDALEVRVDAWREGGVRKASRDAICERRNSIRSVVMVGRGCCVGVGDKK